MSEISYLVVYNPHSGSSEQIPKPIRYHSLAEFKQFLCQQFGIDSPENAFLLTSFGIKLNFNLVNELSDVYVFDKRLFANGYDGAVLRNYAIYANDVPKPSQPQLAHNETNIRQITSSLKSNLGWARAVIQDTLRTEECTKELIRQINIIFRSLNIIFQFGTNFVNEVEKSFISYLNYIKLINYKTLNKSWIDNYRVLQRLPPFKIKQSTFALVDYLDHDRLKGAAQYVSEKLPLVVAKFNGMSEIINSVGQEKLAVDKDIESLRKESMHAFKDLQLNERMDVMQKANKAISADLEKVTNSENVRLDEIYRLHKDKYSPEVYNNAKELYDHFKELKDFKAKLVRESIKVFNSIANIQMKMVNVKKDLKVLTGPSESGVTKNGTNDSTQNEFQSESVSYETINAIKKHEDYLSLTIDIPLLFGFVLIEKRRQFEWYDFYSKGIVNNVSEQLSTIIDHEKLFRKIWLRKFGNFLTLISDDVAHTTSLPNIDITLVGSKDEAFKMLYHIQVEREDIVNYITFVESSGSAKNFAELLNKNFKDLIKSTNNMKKITKVISSLGAYTSLSNEEKSKIIQKEAEDEEEIDFDLNLIKGLKSRIKKLENLLHQQQYKNLTNWPVTRNNAEKQNSDNRLSLIIEPHRRVVTSPPRTDPTSLLQKRPSISKVSPSQSNVLDSTNIDIRLENIRLKKENAELLSRLNEAAQVKDENSSLIESLKVEITQLKSSNESQKREYEAKLAKKDEEFKLYKLDNKMDSKVIENLEKKAEQRDTQISKLQDDLAKFTDLNTKSAHEINALNSTINTVRKELDEAVVMKNDLLANISSQENERIKERNNFEVELQKLQSKIDEVSEDYENLIELTQTRSKNSDLLVNDLNNVIIKLMNDLRRLAEGVFEYFLEFCFVLESMGLLLTKDEGVYKITRVKGLRSKKSVHEDANETSFVSIEKPSSKVIEDVSNTMSWITSISQLSSILPDVPTSSSSASEAGVDNYEEEVNKFNESSLKLITIFNEIFTSNHAKFEEFLKTISFKENVQMQEDSANSSKFFLNAISKRFRDVEGFAKRQTKDNKGKDVEINKLKNRLGSKITMNGFQVNDLVLFLPTRIDRASEVNESIQPWAAFNIGAPHYFLKVNDPNDTKDKEWMVGKVQNIQENKVTEENAGDLDKNPFQLSVGVVWYMVEAIEEHF
ncbi:oligomeric, coiled-coil, peripheral membrane protein [Scheffersomyces xylosifermentans]|uniref:oligomeric, coiled-coil, peripheral membrane protein n=1 Tax=Scheffersomyces xylosifermentans TaxID=1304137 RepID=UPI00315CDD01